MRPKNKPYVYIENGDIYMQIHNYVALSDSYEITNLKTNEVHTTNRLIENIAIFQSEVMEIK